MLRDITVVRISDRAAAAAMVTVCAAVLLAVVWLQYLISRDLAASFNELYPRCELTAWDVFKQRPEPPACTLPEEVARGEKTGD